MYTRFSHIATIVSVAIGVASCTDQQSLAPTNPNNEPKLYVILTEDTVTILESTTVKTFARVIDERGNTVPVPISWRTSDPEVVTVSEGTILGLRRGTAFVVASAGNASDSIVFVVGPKEKQPPTPTDTTTPVAQVIFTAPTHNLTVGQTVQSMVILKDAQGNVLTGRTITYRADKPAVLTVSETGMITAAAVGETDVYASSGGVTGVDEFSVTQPSAPVPPPPPPGPVPPTSPSGAAATILKIVGETKTVTETAALGSMFAIYDQLFDQHLPSSNTWLDNYYDRGVVYYARYARTGDASFLDKAHAITLAYRQQYVEPNGYGIPPHWSLVRGLEIHYRLTGDTLSRRAVAGMYAWGLSSFSTTGAGGISELQNEQSEYMENRIQARVLQAALSAWRMNTEFRRSDGIAFSASEWPTRLREILNQILSVQKADGSYSWAQICGGQLNYMVGMLNDVLIEYYRDFEADPRIPGAVERANEYLWTTQWRSGEKAFKYASVSCSPNPFGISVGGTEPGGDLNGLFIASYGWLYSKTGDQKWKTRGDEIMAGLVLPVWAGSYSSSKHFNQAFAESYRYLGWR